MSEIERLAREHGTGGWQTLDDMVRFGEAVAAAEREACAKVCETLVEPFESGVREDSYKETADRCATAIRARSNAEPVQSRDEQIAEERRAGMTDLA